MKRPPWLEIIAALGIAAIALVCVLNLWPAMQTEESAAWAQGLLTAAGIGVALYAADHQVRSARDHAEAARKDRQQSLLAVLKAGVSYIRELEDAAKAELLHMYLEYDYRPGKFSAVVEMLRGFPFHELATSKTIEATFEIIAGLEKAEAFCKAESEERRDSANLHYRFMQELGGTGGMVVLALMKIDVATDA